MIGSIPVVGMGSPFIDIAVGAGGLGSVANPTKLFEQTPKGRMRVITFGYLQLTGGASRNMQLFIIDRNRDRSVPISMNDTMPRGLTGDQILDQDQTIGVVIAAAANVTELQGSFSYYDVPKPTVEKLRTSSPQFLQRGLPIR